jgi:hypothetical protein
MSEAFNWFVLAAWIVFELTAVVWLHATHRYMDSLNRYWELERERYWELERERAMLAAREETDHADN